MQYYVSGIKMTNNVRQLNFLKLQNAACMRLRSSYLDYANDRSILIFGCNMCDSMLLASAHDYYNGKVVCESCKHSKDNAALTNLQLSAAKIHGDYYQYLDLTGDTVTIKCPKHGAIKLLAHDHIDGKGCDHCKLEDSTNITVSERDTFIEQSNALYGFSYRYDDILYTSHQSPVTIRCPKHGSFVRTPEQHLAGLGCTICMKKATVINDIVWELKNHNIVYSLEKTFPDCVSETGKALHFDIFIPEKNLCVEFDNLHHFEPTKYSDDVEDVVVLEYFNIQQRNDDIKHKYCDVNHINFIRISYTTMFPSAVLLKYMSTLEDQRMIYTWSDFEKDITNIVTYIKTFNYEKFAVYGVSRGGVPFAVHVSNHFEGMCEYGCVSFQRYDGNSKIVDIVQHHQTIGLPIFVIDDLISSGITMNKVIDELKCVNPTSIVHPIVIFGKANSNGVQYMNVHPMKWIVFPYEV